MPLSNYQRTRIGHAVIEPSIPLIAGHFSEFELIYTAGYFGIDDSGSLKIVWRFACDMAKPQFDDPKASNYVSIAASNGAVLDYRFDLKNNIRPWGKTLYVKIINGYFKEGDQLRIRFGDRRGGSPGLRVQTFCEDTFEMKVLVDAFATYDYVELPQSPSFQIVPGKAVRFQAIMPTRRMPGETFSLHLKAEDRWGNPTAPDHRKVGLDANMPVENLPRAIVWPPGHPVMTLQNLVVNQVGDLCIRITDLTTAQPLVASNPMRLDIETDRQPFWGDLHGQSEETIGTNSVRDYFTFARDRAFLDISSHQGNDFQITSQFWELLNQTTAEFNQPGRFITIPGYEFSSNTGLGGDYNVYFLHENETIHRSSHALVADLSDIHTDRHSARELFDTLRKRDAFMYAHVGGRYADLAHAVYGRINPAVEIHSAWGTFEWLLHDAFDLGLRVGVVANSDGHKGRPGASYPGASLFGSYGGLTCFLCQELTRDAIFDALHRRHHYATTGVRLLMDLELGNAGQQVAIGDVLALNDDEVTLKLELLTPSAIESVDIFDGKTIIDRWRPPCVSDSRRIKILWEGAEYRGRGRETVWDGGLAISGNAIKSATPINFWNPDRPLLCPDPRHIRWQSITTGGLAGCEILLKHATSGRITLTTPLIREEISVADIIAEETVFTAGGLGRQVRVFRIPEENRQTALTLTRQIRLPTPGDHPIYARIRLVDGHLAWSSPVYAHKAEGCV